MLASKGDRRHGTCEARGTRPRAMPTIMERNVTLTTCGWKTIGASSMDAIGANASMRVRCEMQRNHIGNSGTLAARYGHPSCPTRQ